MAKYPEKSDYEKLEGWIESNFGSDITGRNRKEVQQQLNAAKRSEESRIGGGGVAGWGAYMRKGSAFESGRYGDFKIRENVSVWVSSAKEDIKGSRDLVELESMKEDIRTTEIDSEYSKEKQPLLMMVGRKISDIGKKEEFRSLAFSLTRENIETGFRSPSAIARAYGITRGEAEEIWAREGL